MVNSAYQLPFSTRSFDVAILRGVLHHLDHPEKAIQEALRVSHTILVIEPNGYNPGLKLLEKFSAYHIEHGEKSYAPHTLDQWVRQGGGQIFYRKWAGFVPFFSPDWLARLMKAMEPFIENAPIIFEFTVHILLCNFKLMAKELIITGGTGFVGAIWLSGR
jgi:SAM-dependent methyltransferase